MTLQRKNRVITVNVGTDILLLPGGKLGAALSQWTCKETFDTKIMSSMLPPPPPAVAEEAWKDLYTTAETKGYCDILIPLNESRIGESKTDKLARDLKYLSSLENSEYAQAGWTTITSLLDGLNMQTFGDTWLAPYFLPNGPHPVEIMVL